MILVLTNLVKRGGVYLYRRSVPEKLRPIVSKREWKVSLKTGDLALAQRRLPLVAAQIERELKEAEAALKSPDVRAYQIARDALETGTGDWQSALWDAIYSKTTTKTRNSSGVSWSTSSRHLRVRTTLP